MEQSPPGETSAAQFSCKLCGRNFSNATSLQIHEQYSHAHVPAAQQPEGSADVQRLVSNEPYPPAPRDPGRMPEQTNGAVVSREEQYYQHPGFWPAAGQQQLPWAELPPTPDSGGLPPGPLPRSPVGDGSEILDLDSSRVHFYSPPQLVSWQQNFHHPYFGFQPPPPGPPQYGHGYPPAPYAEQRGQSGPMPTGAAHPPYPGFPDSRPTDTLSARSAGGKTEGLGQSAYCKRPKTYLCEVCDKKFTSTGHLKRHYNTLVHRQTKEGKRPVGGAGAAKKQRAPDPCGREQTASLPPLVNMPSNMFNMRPQSLPPQYPMTPPMHETGLVSPVSSASFDLTQQQPRPPSGPAPMLAPPPPPTIGYHFQHQMSPQRYMPVSGATAGDQGGLYGSPPVPPSSVEYSGFDPGQGAFGPTSQPSPSSGNDPGPVDVREKSSPSSCFPSESRESSEQGYICCNQRFFNVQDLDQHREVDHSRKDGEQSFAQSEDRVPQETNGHHGNLVAAGAHAELETGGYHDNLRETVCCRAGVEPDISGYSGRGKGESLQERPGYHDNELASPNSTSSFHDAQNFYSDIAQRYRDGANLGKCHGANDSGNFHGNTHIMQQGTF